MNGYVWIKTHHTRNLVTLRSILLSSEYLLLESTATEGVGETGSGEINEVEKWKHINVLMKCMLDKVLPQHEIV